MNIPSHIDALIAKYLQGEALPSEAMELEDWCNESRDHRIYFEQMQKLYSGIDGLDRSIPDSESFSKKMRFNLWKSKMGKWAVAATLFAVLSLSFWMVGMEEPQVIMAASQTLHHQLKDASQIELSPGAQITVPVGFSSKHRRVALKGKATFEVTHSDQNKFTVDAGGVYIEDLGTRFTVNANPLSDTLYVIVTEGVVRLFDDAGNEIIVKAGQSAWYIRSTKKIVASPETQVVRFDFDKTKLADIVGLLQETYQIKIVLQPKEIGDCTITTQFFDEEIATIPTVLCETLDFSYSYSDQVYTIKGKPCQ